MNLTIRNITAVLLISSGLCLIVSESKRTEILSAEWNYVVSWEVDKDTSSVTFEISVDSKGYIGFGVSSNGGMANADLIIGGVFDNGTVYFSDRHGPSSGNGFPPEDASQDFTLLNATETETSTVLTFRRDIDTCDIEQDILFTQNTVRFLWAVGLTDDITYHSEHRGALSINILGEPYPEADLSMYNKFNVSTTVTLPIKDTLYWCTVHKTPQFLGKQHAVAFSSDLKGELSVKHSHHLSIYSCQAPEGEDPETFFNKYVEQGGIDCLDRKPGEISAYPYCIRLIYTWTIGGRPMLLPENVGFPIGENEHEFYLMESHFDNPERLEGLTFESGVLVYHTEELREIEAGVMRIGQMYDYNFIVPPNSVDYLVVGHCSSNCTNEWIPEEGVNIFNVMLHSHAFGRKMKLRQFRGTEELEWVINDDNYDNSYQDNRNIPLRKLMPGDQMAIECQYDNSWLDPQGTVVGGFSTREEMCEVVFYFYPRNGLENCRSNILKPEVLAFFGIESVISDNGTVTNPLITAPEELAGIRLLDYLDNLDWSTEMRQGLEDLMRFSLHEEQCGGDGFQKRIRADPVYITYPELEHIYTPPVRNCNVTSSSNN